MGGMFVIGLMIYVALGLTLIFALAFATRRSAPKPPPVDNFADRLQRPRKWSLNRMKTNSLQEKE